MAQVNQPNDRVFRKALSDLRVARALLRQHVPPEMLQVIDLSCLETCKETYIEADFCSVTTDILFKTQIKQRSGYVYLLLEHQSTPDKLMPFRLLR